MLERTPWTDHEIATLQRRTRALMQFELPEPLAEELAERLLNRDRDPFDDRRICLECRQLAGDRCRAWGASRVQKFEPCKTILQRCHFFQMKGSS